MSADPNNFYARHNYAQGCFLAGDVGADQPNMRLAVIQFTKAIVLNPTSARSYTGRGWAYLMLDDQAQAGADFRKTLTLDPSLRSDLENEANGILEKKRQGILAEGILNRMGRYTVEKRARSGTECQNTYKGYWTGSECRISTALNPVR